MKALTLGNRIGYLSMAVAFCLLSFFVSSGNCLARSLDTGVTTGVALYDQSGALVGNYRQIQEAINAAQSSYTVVASPGTYEENIDIPQFDLTIKSLVGPEVTIIRGDQTRDVVHFAEGAGSGSVLQGFTIENGYWDGPAHGELGGGGITIKNASPVVRNCIIKENISKGFYTYSGGGIHIENSDSVIVGCKVLNNTVIRSQGGGIAIIGGAPTIGKCQIIGNRTSDYLMEGGGVIVANNSNAVIVDSLVSQNAGPTFFGAGLSVQNHSFVSISRTIFSGNFAVPPASYSDGCALRLSNAKMDHCLIIDNNDIGISLQMASHLDMVNCTVADNVFAGILLLDSTLSVKDSISWNRVLTDPEQAATITYTDVYGGYIGEGNINADPLFVGNGDYHLTEDSPCIDAGDPNSPQDPDGTRADMGAYYFPHF